MHCMCIACTLHVHCLVILSWTLVRPARPMTESQISSFYLINSLDKTISLHVRARLYTLTLPLYSMLKRPFSYCIDCSHLNKIGEINLNAVQWNVVSLVMLQVASWFCNFRVFAFASQFMIELKAAKENDRFVTLGVPRLATLTFST